MLKTIQPSRIAFSMRVVGAAGYDETRDALSHDWVRWSEKLGAIALAMPNAASDVARFLDFGDPELIVLTGGNDAVRGRPDGDPAPVRDRCEHAMLEYAAARDIPVLAVCRGMHVLNLHFGGRVQAALPGDGVGHAGQPHEIEFEPIALAGCERMRVTTNSFHRQGVIRDGAAPALRILATCTNDGVVEALAHPEHRMLGLQWHPERAGSPADVDEMLLQALLSPLPFWSRTR